MTDEEKVLKRLKDTLDVLTGKNVITNLDFQIRNMVEDCIRVIQTQQEKIEYYKKQKDYDDQFKHELLEEIRCKSLEIDSLNKVLDDRLICIQGGRGLYAKLRGLDKEYLIREYLSMYKMCKAELEKKDKIIDLTITFISTRYKEDEEINNFAKEVMERGEWTNLNKILKEYFINKVEKENKDE